MKLRIAVIEDEKTEREYLKTAMNSWAEKNRHTLTITECESGEEFLFKYPETACFDLIFSDICMGQMNGCELAKQIRSRNKQVCLVFLTGVSDYVFEGYKIGILRYLLKPLQVGELYQLLAGVVIELEEKQEDFFPLFYQGENLRLSFSEILYVQVDGHYVKMKTNTGEYEWKGSLSKMKELLHGKEFVSVNRSTIVNLLYVSKITREYCVLETGMKLDVSRNEYAKVNQAFMEFYL